MYQSFLDCLVCFVFVFLVNIKTYFINSLVLSFKTDQTETKPITQTNNFCRVNFILLQWMWKSEELFDIVITQGIAFTVMMSLFIIEVKAP